MPTTEYTQNDTAYQSSLDPQTMRPWPPEALCSMAMADPQDPDTWPPQVETLTEWWQDIEPYCQGHAWHSAEERYRAVVMTAVEAETARAMAFCDAALDALRSRVAPVSMESRLLSHLRGGLMYLRDATVDATLHAAHTLGGSLPEDTTDDDLFALARQVSSGRQQGA